MKSYLFVVLIGLAVACSSSRHVGGSASSSAQDGSSFEKAIVIQETHESPVLTIVTADGTEKKIYFDISNFFGKF
jgi:hypothetical protein